MTEAAVESRSPQNPHDLVVRVAACDADTVRTAVTTARERARVWGRSPAPERAGALTALAAALDDDADALAALITREVGKPLTEARGEVARAAALVRFHAQTALLPDGETHPALPPSRPESLTLSRRRPRGVAGLITPWNFPLAIPLWKAAPALAYGNAVVLKPSPEATATALRLAELAAAHLPDGLFAVVPGDEEAGRALVDAADVISFTGSNVVGRHVARQAAARGIPVQCEMGGLNASIVLPDSDLDAVATIVASSAMGYAGQKCTATSRIIVVGDPAPFTEALVAATDALTVGDPGDAATVVGPVISETARSAVLAATRDGRVLTGGAALSADGHFVAPTLVDRLPDDAVLMREEVFGPVAAVVAADSVEAALAINAAVPHGLVTSVFTGDLSAALWVCDNVRTGMVRVNQPTSGVDFHAPFGGEGESSIGPREQGLAARELYTSLHTYGISPAPRTTPHTR